MEKWWQLNKILWKQYLVRHRMGLVLFLVVGILLSCFGRQMEAEDYSGIKAGVFAEDEEGKRLLEKLEKEEGILQFESFAGEEEMVRKIVNGTLECGFTLPAGFYENMKKGKMMRQVELYYSPSSAAHKISYEVVFSYLFEELSDDVLMKYMDHSEENGVFDKEETKENRALLLALKDKYSKNGTTFSFSYKQVQAKGEEPLASFSVIRGCIAVFIFFMSLLGFAGCLEVNEMSKGLAGSKRIRIREWSLHIAVFSSVFLGGVLLALWGGGEGIGKELMGLFLYFIVLEIYIRILKLFLRRPGAVYGSLPLLLLGSLLFCPVFIRMKTYLPVIGFLEKLFPPSYYLNLF